MRQLRGGAVVFVLAAVAPVASHAGVVWNEGVNGDLSNNQGAPTSVGLVAGANSVIGVSGIGDTQDWLTFTVPAGMQLSSLVLVSYLSTDPQGFMGVQAGATFVGNPFVAGSYLGFGHFGTGAVNGPLPPTDLVGADMLPIMGDTTLAPGSQGFTPPLGPGTYTLLIQQLGAATEYRFDFNLVPTPGGVAVAALATLGQARRSRRV
jgi:hypothetical protein